MALWNMYNNSNASSPEVQREALNLAESPIPPMIRSPIVSIKRERESHHNEVNDYHVPPAKRGLMMRRDSDLNRKNSISSSNNNNHHHISNNNNAQVIPLKAKIEHEESPENGDLHHRHKSNGDSIGTTILNGMQFKIISKGMLSSVETP